MLLGRYFARHYLREYTEVRGWLNDALRPGCFFYRLGLNGLLGRIIIEQPHLPSLQGIRWLVGVDEAPLQVLLLHEFDDVLQGRVHIRLPTLQSSYDAREIPTN